MLWIALYLLLILAPLAVARLGDPPPHRGFFVEFGVGLGFVGLAMLALQFVLTARIRHIAPLFGTDVMLQFHRQAGLVAYLFILAHIGVLLVADRAFLAFFDPRVNAPRAAALSLVLILLTLIIVLTLWRQTFRLVFEWWRLTHGLFSLLVILIGLAHVLMVSHYTTEAWQRLFFIALVGGAAALLLHARLLKPMLMRRTPYRVARITPEAERTWTLELRPEGHPGVRFRPGQFAWLTFGDRPFSLEQHPFSFASSAERRDACLFTIKELGDFTDRISQIPLDSRAFLEGPYGAFTLDPEPDRRAIFFVGGIGITPVMSMLRTLHDRQDPRQLLLIYANRHEGAIAFRSELDELAKSLRLRVVHILEDPPQDWRGETGHITPELIDQHCPHDDGSTEYFVCGPETMMDVVESALRSRGVPLRRLLAERFEIA